MRDAEAKPYDRLEKAGDDAEKKDCVVVIPGRRELFIDIDDESTFDVFVKRIGRLAEFFPLSWSSRPSPSERPGRHHVTVTLQREVTSLERIALQAILGSDWLRELLSFVRYDRKDDAPTLFFEKRGGPRDPNSDAYRDAQRRRDAGEIVFD